MIHDAHAVFVMDAAGDILVTPGLLDWPPLLWTVRVAMFLVFVAGVGLCVRAARSVTVRVMAGPPGESELEGLDQQVEALARRAGEQALAARELRRIGARLDDLVRQVDDCAALVARDLAPNANARRERIERLTAEMQERQGKRKPDIDRIDRNRN